MPNHNIVRLDGTTLSIDDVINVAESDAENTYSVAFAAGIEEKIRATRKQLEYQLDTYPEIEVYGTNVGAGDLKDNRVSRASAEDQQERYIKAHNCGTGEPLPKEIVRAMMVIRLNSFARNLSAMRWETCALMVDMLNKGVTPEILEEGSVGASGDLVPLAMMAAVMIGLPEAYAYYEGKRLPGPQAMAEAGIEITKLGAKEAMGLTNGSNFLAAFGAFAVRDAELLIKNASISSALSLEAIRGEKDAFSELINKSRRHKGQTRIAKQIRELIEGSKRTTVKAQKEQFPTQHLDTVKGRVQDRYSFRAIPPVHGAACEAIAKLKRTIRIEINSATDNPLFLEEEINSPHVQSKLEGISDSNNTLTLDKLQVDDNLNGRLLCDYSGANFHGQPLATVIDYAKLSLTGLALITDKRTFSLIDKDLNYGLPKDLAVNPRNGDTGLMIAQYAGAARVAENRVLSTPASVMSISTSANQEDFVSMGSIGAIHLRRVIRNTRIVVAIELLCALRGLQMSHDYLPEPLRALGAGTSRAYEFLDKEMPLARDEKGEPLGDTYLKTDIDRMIGFVKDGSLVNLVQDLLP